MLLWIHTSYLRFGLLLMGCEIDTIFGRTFKLFRCKSPAFESKKILLHDVRGLTNSFYFLGYCNFEAKCRHVGPATAESLCLGKELNFWQPGVMFDELFLSLWDPQSLHWLRISLMGLKREKLLSHWPVVHSYFSHLLIFFAQFVATDSFQHPRKKMFPFNRKSNLFLLWLQSEFQL